MLLIMMVDNESAAIDGLTHILKKNAPEYVIAASAFSVKEALSSLEKLNGAVDVIISDVKMPDIDGVQFVKLLKGKYGHIPIVMLSGYSDYAYVRECLKSGAVDYLLKPCRYQDLISVLHKVENEILFRQVFSGGGGTRQALNPARRRMQAIPASLMAYDSLHFAYMIREETNAASLAAALKRRIDQSFDLTRAPTLIEYGKDVLIFADGQPSYAGFSGWIRSLFGGPAVIGALRSSVLAHIQPMDFNRFFAVVTACHRAAAYLEFNECLGAFDLPAAQSEMDRAAEHHLNAFFNAERIAQLISGQQTDALSDYIHSIVTQFMNHPEKLNPTTIKKLLVGELLRLEDLLHTSCRIDVRQKLSGSFLSDLEALNTRSQVAVWLENQFREILGHFKTKSFYAPKYITLAIEFIKQRYMEDLRLADVSSHVYLNEWYFSNQFKKYTSMTFKQCLNNIRIDAAKHLLQDTDLKIGAVSEMVGFTDSTYFSVVFRRTLGMTPSEYRKSLIPFPPSGGR